ncbi:hypothetical protein, partial [Rivularia sp. UHCC 0363]|uniref:hypothetical protein n=1 Tax=Rivularia sp. UHCC 0363 TaxID=3110244 RepID=UPI002B200D65
MENIKPLANQASRLGIAASLCEANRLTLRKESNFLYRPKRLTQHFVNKLLLVKTSKLFLPRKHKNSFNSLIDWDFGTDNHDFHDADSLQTSDLLTHRNANYYTSQQKYDIKTVISDAIPDILPTINFVDNPVHKNQKNQTKSRKKTQAKSKPKAKRTSKKSKAITQSLETGDSVSPQVITPQTPQVTTSQTSPVVENFEQIITPQNQEFN